MPGATFGDECPLSLLGASLRKAQSLPPRWLAAWFDLYKSQATLKKVTMSSVLITDSDFYIKSSVTSNRENIFMTILRHFFDSWSQNFLEVIRYSKIFNPELRWCVAPWSGWDLRKPMKLWSCTALKDKQSCLLVFVKKGDRQTSQRGSNSSNKNSGALSHLLLICVQGMSMECFTHIILLVSMSNISMNKPSHPCPCPDSHSLRFKICHYMC